MLNDYGKALFKPLVSVQNFVIAGSVIFFALLIIRVFRLTSEEIASWVQAIGSIAAIWGAFSLSNNQIKRQERQRELAAEQKNKAVFAVVEHAVLHARAVHKSLSSADGKQKFKLGWDTGYSEIFKSALKSLSLIPVHELGGYELVIAHNHILGAMINISKKVERYVSAEHFVDQEFEVICLDVWGLTEIVNFYWPNFENAQ